MNIVRTARNVSALLAVCGIAAYGGFVATGAVLDAPDGKLRRSPLPNGATLEAVFVGASTCAASRSSALPRDLKAALSLLRDSATAAGISFSTIGVALDWVPADGINWLKRIADFDEVIAGRNWANLGAIDYLWNDSLTVPAMPQLIVAIRTVATDSARVVASAPHTVLRLLGPGSLHDWVERHSNRSALR
jgi:hypothetical protein